MNLAEVHPGTVNPESCAAEEPKAGKGTSLPVRCVEVYLSAPAGLCHVRGIHEMQRLMWLITDHQPSQDST